MAKTLIAAAREWNDGDVFKHSAAVSFDTLFSLAPITIIAVGVAGIFFGKEAATKQFSEQMSQLVGNASAQVIQKAMEASALEDSGWVATAVGIGILMLGATTVFGQLQDSLNAIWGVTAKPNRRGWTVMIMQR